MNLNIDLTALSNTVLSNFYPLLKCKDRYIILRGGAGSGKTKFAVQKLLLRILVGYKKNIEHKILVVMKEYSSMKENIFDEFVKQINEWKLNELVKITTSPLHIQFLFIDSSIVFRGCDEPEKLKGIRGVTSILIDEADRINLHKFEIVITRLRGVPPNTYGQMILTFNPVSKNNWLYDYFYSDLKDNTKLHHSVVKDNYLLNDEPYKKSIEDFKHTNINKYKTYWLGEWGSLEGVIYENFDVVEQIPEKVNEVIYGLDFGFNNPSALIKISDCDGEYYIEELLYETELTNNDLIKRLEALISSEDKRTCYMYADCAEPARIEEIYRQGFNCHGSDKSVLDGIDFVQSQKLHIHKNSYNTIKEIEGYSWKTDKEGKTLDEPLKIDDHAMDSIRYALYTHYGNRPSFNLIVP